MARMPTQPELEAAVREALSVANVEEMSLKMIRRGLEERFEVDLTEEKAFLKERVTAILCEEGQDDEEVEDQDQKIVEKNEQQEGREEEEQEREEEDVKPANRAEAKQAGKAKPKAADQQLSPALFEFMGGKENLMTRGDVTKAVWAYIREQSLQDPKDRRKIRNDDKMFRVFKCKTMSMMHIAKKLTPHLKKYSELVGSGDGDHGDQRGTGAKKRKAGAASTTPKAKKAQAQGGSSSKGRPKPAVKGGAKSGTKTRTPTGGRR